MAASFAWLTRPKHRADLLAVHKAALKAALKAAHKVVPKAQPTLPSPQTKLGLKAVASHPKPKALRCKPPRVRIHAREV
jgi:hypothetical protein